ncbi:MAG TPA: serine hydrolase domain-containing protein [Rhodothermales bacterium]|nr:serine hydrolase domain-containing protein [Rhodothermales bacterium]
MRIQQTIGNVALSVPLVLIASSSAAQQVATDRALASASNQIETLVAPQAEAEFLSGIILVARGNQILFQRAYGFANWELRVPNSPSTRFGSASITKPMTETLVHVLATAGRVDLDAPVERYLPGFPRGPRGGKPTVRHLLAHRAGVPHRVTDAIEETQVLSPSNIVERVRAKGLLFEPGTQRLYSSAGYTCLARVIEVIEDKPFESVLAERVFRPARMTAAISETGQGLMPRRAMPYRLGGDGRQVVVKGTPYKDLRFLTGAGSVYATAEDLLHFVQAIRAGVFGSDLPEEAFGGDPTIWHSWTGRTNGYETSVDALPSGNLTFVFLSNLQSAANWQIREQIQNALLGQPSGAIPLPPPVAAPFEEPASLVGSYGPAEITLVDGQLFRGDNEFYAIEGRRYYIPASGSIMRFRRDSAGVVDAIISIGGGGQETVLPKSGGR